MHNNNYINHLCALCYMHLIYKNNETIPLNGKLNELKNCSM